MRRGEERRGTHGILSAVFSPWVRSLGNTNPAAKEEKTRKEKKRERRGEEGEDDGKQGRRAEERVGMVQTNGEKGLGFFGHRKMIFPSVF